MGKSKPIKNLYNYKTIPRETINYRMVEDRLKDYKEILVDYSEEQIKSQASRCQNCGIPFCHGYGCPISNYIPDWNELVYQGRWEEAAELLHKTNNFPEITGRVCPSPCEESCTLNYKMDAVTIRNIELVIVEKAFTNGWIKPILPKKRTGKTVAIIGSGPAGLTAAQDINRMGHTVTLFERDEKAGGFLRYGIPDFKLEKNILDRRLKIMVEEGVVIKTNTYVGEDITSNYLMKNFDSVLLTVGSREPRDLNIDGRNLAGIHFATDYLKQSNMRVDGYIIPDNKLIDAKGKNVVVIGGGDTGADCVGTARRQGALSVSQWEILPKPPQERADDTPWPMYAKKLRTSSSHEEGCERKWCITSKKFSGQNNVESITASKVEWIQNDSGRWEFNEINGSQFEQKAELVLLAMGFTHPVHDSLIKGFDIELDKLGNIKTSNYGYGKTNVEKVFAAGDSSRGASLVVWAIHYGKQVAKMIDAALSIKM